MLAVADVEHWLADKSLPKTIVYHRGHLAFDRLRHEMHDGRVIEVTHEPLSTVATMLFNEFEKGKVLLFQSRVGPFEWDYVALRKGT